MTIRGSNEGDEPHLLEDEFKDRHEWTTLDAAFLDQAPGGFGSALSFFSPEAFRYFLPAFLLADLDDGLDRANPAFHLTHGLDDLRRAQPVNPRRYGGWTWREAMAERFDPFTHAQVESIVAYLRYKARMDDFARPQIEQALANYWAPRLS